MKTMKNVTVILALLWGFANLAQAQVEKFLEGTHYLEVPEAPVLKELLPRGTKPEVVEIFWYGCPHCYEFDPMLANWVQQHGSSIEFTRRPMIWNAGTKHHARIFYTAQALGMGDKLHKSFFDSIHQQKNYLQDGASVKPLFVAAGISDKQFESTFNGPVVESLVKKDETLLTALQVPSVPAMLVNGRYLVQIGDAVPSHKALLEVTEFLLRKK